MLYCGLRKEVVWDGWHAAVPGLESIGESSTRARLRELMDGALTKAEEVFDGHHLRPRRAAARRRIQMQVVRFSRYLPH